MAGCHTTEAIRGRCPTVYHLPVLCRSEDLEEGQPAGSDSPQRGDAVVIQMQLSEEDLVVQTRRLTDKQGEVVS